MPTHLGKDKDGCYAQWGEHGAKYHYACGDKYARSNAVGKANKQGQAIKAQQARDGKSEATDDASTA